jgi:hypothetical protein
MLLCLRCTLRKHAQIADHEPRGGELLAAQLRGDERVVAGGVRRDAGQEVAADELVQRCFGVRPAGLRAAGPLGGVDGRVRVVVVLALGKRERASERRQRKGADADSCSVAHRARVAHGAGAGRQQRGAVGAPAAVLAVLVCDAEHSAQRLDLHLRFTLIQSNTCLPTMARRSRSVGKESVSVRG